VCSKEEEFEAGMCVFCVVCMLVRECMLYIKAYLFMPWVLECLVPVCVVCCNKPGALVCVRGDGVLCVCVCAVREEWLMILTSAKHVDICSQIIHPLCQYILYFNAFLYNSTTNTIQLAKGSGYKVDEDVILVIL